jgi:hypothetical protein
VSLVDSEEHLSSTAGPIPLPDGLNVPMPVVLHILKMMLGLGPTQVLGKTICLRDVHKTGRAFKKEWGLKPAYFSKQEGIVRFLVVVSSVLRFMNDFAAAFEPPEGTDDLQEGGLALVRSPVGKLSFVFEDPTRWQATVLWVVSSTNEALVHTARARMLDGLMGKIFGNDQQGKEKCIEQLHLIAYSTEFELPKAVLTLSSFRGDRPVTEGGKTCKCASLSLPSELLEAHQTIVLESGEAVVVNHVDLGSKPKKSKKGSKVGGARAAEQEDFKDDEPGAKRKGAQSDSDEDEDEDDYDKEEDDDEDDEDEDDEDGD